MKGLLLVAALLAASSVSGVVHAETMTQDVDSRGQVAEKARSGGGLRKFFAALAGKASRKPSVETVAYTRAWVDAQPKATGDENWKCLAEALYFESRGETVKGQFAVAEVIRNRVASARFPDTYCGVIRQGTGRKFQCQFTYTCDGRKEVISEKQAYDRVAKVARAVIDGVAANLTDGATYYHNTTVRPRWARRFTKTAQIGVHLFYRPKLQTASNG